MQSSTLNRSNRFFQLASGKSEQNAFLIKNPFDRDIGDSRKKAKDIGTLKRGSSYKKSGDVGGDDLDFFKVKLDGTTDFSAQLSNKDSGKPIAVTILDKKGKAVQRNGEFLFKNVNAGDTQTISVSGLPKGTYFIRLQSEEGSNESYKLKLSRSLSTDSGNGSNGSSKGNRKELGSLDSDRRYDYSGSVGGSDVDFYNFNLNSNSRFEATLSNSSNDPIAVSILDSSDQTVKTTNGRFLFGNANANSDTRLFDPTLPAGKYKIRVQSDVGSNEDYRLSLRRSPA
jgi:Secretion system C-terminal sorting domain